MSYEIIKKIRIDENKVYLTSTSNNVSPRHFREWECKTLSEILQNEGSGALDLELLKEYENGNFQPGNPNKWSTAISRLKQTKEYEKYSWRISDYGKDCPIQAARKTNEFNVLLINSLNIKPSKERYIVKKDAFDTEYFVYRVTSRHIKYRQGRDNAKIFKIKSEAERIVNMFPEYKLITL